MICKRLAVVLLNRIRLFEQTIVSPGHNNPTFTLPYGQSNLLLELQHATFLGLLEGDGAIFSDQF